MAGPSAIPDHHVHTQFSWDAGRGDMEASCRRAIELGLPSIAFTEHADFTEYVRARDGLLDVAGYRAEVERCRSLFPGLRILSGVELGEPHRFPAEVAAIMAGGGLDRVLGSVHCVEREGRLVDVSTPGLLAAGPAAAFAAYLDELAALLRGGVAFDVLAHLDYPKRYWPEADPFDLAGFEEPIRAVLREAARLGVALELNTTRGLEPARFLCPGPGVLAWWVEEGGRALAFGSDAHDPSRIAAGFALAAEVAEAAGFRPQDDPSAYWTR